MFKLVNYVMLCRPQQWMKNLFVFLPLFFDKNLFNFAYFINTLWVFISFCFIASSIYCLNDVIDCESDRLHPIKKKRPIACGALSVSSAYFLMIVLCLLSFAILLFLPLGIFYKVALCIAFYFILNLLYCFKLKKFAILDVFIIAIGYVLRVIAGASSTNIHTSEWIMLLTFLITLFIAFAKRRDDVIVYESTGEVRRKSISSYNLQFMNQVLTLLASVTIICYIMYTISPEVEGRFNNKNLYLSSLFVVAGIIRYLQLTLVFAKSGNPTEIILKDRFLQICIFFWILFFFIIIYIQ